MSKKLRAVLAGAGGISSSWLKPLSQRSDIVVAAVVDPVKENADRRIGEFNLNAHYYPELAAALAAENFDILLDCSIPAAHFPNALAALAHGCHVLSEKPVAESTAQVRELIAAARRADRIHAVIQNRRYLDGIVTFQQAVDRRIGRLTTLDADFYLGVHFGGFREAMEHVLLLDMAIHSFDQARLISGCNPVKVFCREWNPAGSWFRHGASAVAVFTMTDGVVFTYRGSWCAEGCSTSWACDWRAVGTEGSVRWIDDRIYGETVVERGGFRDVVKPFHPRRRKLKFTGHAGCIDEFLRCVRHGGTPQTASSDNIYSLTMVESAIRSAETGKEVDIDL